ncbi:MAG: hypothetical protein LBJ18_00180 [Rickettsiales bacterium]|jgi:hypothetical protein|nr:hypothetical protein [Rickettsiales bacterium]
MTKKLNKFYLESYFKRIAAHLLAGIVFISKIFSLNSANAYSFNTLTSGWPTQVILGPNESFYAEMSSGKIDCIYIAYAATGSGGGESGSGGSGGSGANGLVLPPGTPLAAFRCEESTGCVGIDTYKFAAVAEYHPGIPDPGTNDVGNSFGITGASTTNFISQGLVAAISPRFSSVVGGGFYLYCGMNGWKMTIDTYIHNLGNDIIRVRAKRFINYPGGCIVNAELTYSGPDAGCNAIERDANHYCDGGYGYYDGTCVACASTPASTNPFVPSGWSITPTPGPAGAVISSISEFNFYTLNQNHCKITNDRTITDAADNTGTFKFANACYYTY